MRILRRLLAVIAFVCVGAVIAGLMLPREIEVARSTVIAAPAEAIFPYLNNLRRFNEWSPWAGRDPDAVYTFAGPETGVGAIMSFASEHPEVGTGWWRIVDATADEYVRLAQNADTVGVATSDYRLAPRGGGTRVTWALRVDAGANPLTRLKGALLDLTLGPDYEAGLARLKRIVEQHAKNVERVPGRPDDGAGARLSNSDLATQ